MKKTPEQLRKDFWEEDAKKGGVIFKQYAQIKEVLNHGDLKWNKSQYRAIKEHAIAYTDFYKNYSADDAFPVVNKSILISNYEAVSAKGGFEKPIHISSTSGSTGTPFSVLQDAPKRLRTIADLKVFGELCDYPSHERMVFFRGTTKNRTPEQEDKENIYYIDCGHLSDENLENMRKAIVEKKPRIIFSYTSTLVEIAKYIERNHLVEPYTMVAALTAGEGCSDENRNLLESVFGCKVYRRYSDMELGILAQDNGDGGQYHLNIGSYYFEFLKLNSDEPSEPGEESRIVITDLFNKAFPMIRYDTGDLGVWGYDNGIPVLKEIFGKKMDCVYSTRGSLISPHKLEILMWGYESIKQWQFVQETQYDYVIKINGDKRFDYSEIIEKFKGYLGEDANIFIQFVDEIPTLASNKRRMVICNYKETR